METTIVDLSTAYAITPAEAAQYRKEGHIIVRGVVSAEELEYIRPLIIGCADALARTGATKVRLEDDSTLFTHVTNIWRKSETAREVVFAKRFARIAAELMGVRGVRLYHDEVQLKDPGGTRTPWHKDHFYWPLATRNTIKMWLALSDVSPDMGGMVFVTGSHRSGLFPEVPFSLNTQEIFNRAITTHNIPTTTYTLRAGDATFHSGDLLHSALENSSDQRREVLSIIYYADGTRVMVPNHAQRALDLKEFLPGLEPGDVAASDANPLLHESAL